MRFTLALALAVFLSFPASAQTVSDKAFIDNAKKAVSLLYSQDSSGTMNMRCTATAFSHIKDSYLFVTAAHCIGPDRGDENTPRSADPSKTIFFVTFDETKEKRFWRADPRWIGLQHRGEDFAVFEVKSIETWPTIGLGNEHELTDGAEYFNLASPLGLGVQVFTGSISSMSLERPLIEGDINWSGSLVLQQAGVNGGSSGSALISKETRKIVGFLVGVIGGSSIIGIPVSRFLSVQGAVEQGKYKYWQPDSNLNPDGTRK